MYRESSSNAVFLGLPKKTVLEGKTVLEDDFLSTIFKYYLLLNRVIRIAIVYYLTHIIHVYSFLGRIGPNF